MVYPNKGECGYCKGLRTQCRCNSDCGERGLHPCPKRKIMCCHCFDSFYISELHVLPNGDIVDVCKQCAEDEALIMAEKEEGDRRRKHLAPVDDDKEDKRKHYEKVAKELEDEKKED